MSRGGTINQVGRIPGCNAPVPSNAQNWEDKSCRVGPRPQGDPSMQVRPSSAFSLATSLVMQQTPLEGKLGGQRKASDDSHTSPCIPLSIKSSRQGGSDPRHIILGTKPWSTDQRQSFGQTRGNGKASVMFQLQAQKISKARRGDTMAGTRTSCDD